MEILERIPCPKGKRLKCLFGRRYYRLWKEWAWHSDRYNISITAPPGIYDGATLALDTKPKPGNPPAWLIHDAICAHPFDDNGAPINSKMAATILSDLLKENGHPIRAFTWKYGTFWFGCVKARQNGWF